MLGIAYLIRVFIVVAGLSFAGNLLLHHAQDVATSLEASANLFPGRPGQ